MLRRVALLATVHGVCALVLAPSGLLLPFRAYISVWAAWLLTGIVAWAKRRATQVVLALMLADLALLVTVFVALPAFVVSTP